MRVQLGQALAGIVSGFLVGYQVGTELPEIAQSILVMLCPALNEEHQKITKIYRDCLKFNMKCVIHTLNI